MVMCLVIGFDLVFGSIIFLHSGHLMGDRHRRVLNVTHPALFWMGRDRIVLSPGKVLRAIGFLLLLAGIWFITIGALGTPPH